MFDRCVETFVCCRDGHITQRSGSFNDVFSSAKRHVPIFSHHGEALQGIFVVLDCFFDALFCAVVKGGG